MIYRVERKENPFVQVDKGFVNDKRLGFKEKGILLYFLSKPDGWNFYEEEIAANSTDGLSAVKAGIQKLMENGYITRGERQRNEKGQLGPYEYVVKEVSATCENPTQVFPTQENPTQENHTLVKNEDSNIYKSNIESKDSPIPPAGDCEQGPHGYERVPKPSAKEEKQAALMQRFEVFYKAYPRHKSRGDAEKAWRALKPDDALFAKIMEALEVAKQDPDWQKENHKYAPYPASWLRGKGWADEPDTDSDASADHTEQKPAGGANLW